MKTIFKEQQIKVIRARVDKDLLPLRDGRAQHGRQAERHDDVIGDIGPIRCLKR